MSLNIYALTDSHQECRNLCKLLSYIYQKENNKKQPFIILDCGDIFKGVYDKNLCVNSYIKISELLPQTKIFLTLGNNDFGFCKKDFEYLLQTITKFRNNNINFVCGNLYETDTDKPAQFIPQYKIVNINNEKILITGFCLPVKICEKFGFTLKPIEQSYQNLLKNIKQDYDKIIVLNHHWYPYSRELKDFANTIGKPIDLIIGGHEHSRIDPDYENNIFYPLSFARALYNFNNHKISEVDCENLTIIPELEFSISKYEKETKLFEPVAKRILNLSKAYSEPCPLGTFISDNMKKIAKTDIAFHSTGFTMYKLTNENSDIITKYDFEKVICATTPIVKFEITTSQLKKVFENAILNRAYKNNGNAKFIQCSQNIKIQIKKITNEMKYEVIQIYIDGKALLNNNGLPQNPSQKFSCSTDEFLANGGQGYDILKGINKDYVLENNKKVQINEVLLRGLKEAETTYTHKCDYPSYIIEEF